MFIDCDSMLIYLAEEAGNFVASSLEAKMKAANTAKEVEVVYFLFHVLYY